MIQRTWQPAWSYRDWLNLPQQLQSQNQDFLERLNNKTLKLYFPHLHIVLTWVAAYSWLSQILVKVHCSAFQTHCSFGPCIASLTMTVLLWHRGRVQLGQSCVFGSKLSQARGPQTEVSRRKPEWQREKVGNKKVKAANLCLDKCINANMDRKIVSNETTVLHKFNDAVFQNSKMF